MDSGDALWLAIGAYGAHGACHCFRTGNFDMSGESPFCVEGLVVETLPNTLVRVELANGHCLLGHVARRQLPLVGRLTLGATVTVKLTPSDLSHGYVILNESKL